jgi:hypothetical protein
MKVNLLSESREIKEHEVSYKKEGKSYLTRIGCLLNPCRANSCDIVRPMPVPPPVTNTTASENSPSRKIEL